jgi:hypothetical protein
MEKLSEANSNGFLLKRKVFNDFAFVHALRELAKQPLEIKTAWNVNRIIKQAQTTIDNGQVEIKALLEKYAVKDEAGKYKMVETGDFEFSDKEAFQKDYEAFGEQEVEFKSYRLNLDVLEGIKISPESIGALEPIVDVQ